MRLDRTNVTAASRIMLPAYVVLFAGLGINYALTPEGRLTQSPPLSFAGHILPLPVWGLLFGVLSALMLTSLITGSRTAYRYGLWLGILCLGTWAVVFIAAAIFDNGSPGAFLWPGFAAVACFASNRSLLRGEA